MNDEYQTRRFFNSVLTVDMIRNEFKRMWENMPSSWEIMEEEKKEREAHFNKPPIFDYKEHPNKINGLH